TGVGQHQMWAMQYLRTRQARTFLSSAGFGTMGFGLPAALGAKAALPQVPVIDIDGDGSLNMTINELSTCRRYGLGVKVFVVNNQWLGMVRQWQDMIYQGNRVLSALGDGERGAKPLGNAPYPDFLAIAAGYGVAAERVERAEDLPAALERMLADPNQPYLLDVMVAREDNVFPMIPAGKSYRDVIFAPV
ncbi:MAG: acetolactate synthase, large subunit, biosynthetic type, partial [Burkholderiales bacterium]|nr:acetolactate synthase, large subunit, biosynthetic type [Burkholderiales bacterium]